MKKKVSLLLIAFLLPFFAHADSQTEFEAFTLNWLDSDVVIDAVVASNLKHKDLTEEQILALDNQWREEIKSWSYKLVLQLINTDISKFLYDEKKKHSGKITEIILMDNVGLNVGQSNISTDYWQGDEDKFIKTYLADTDQVFKSKPNYDDSTQMYQYQLSRRIKDKHGNAIGAITLGISTPIKAVD